MPPPARRAGHFLVVFDLQKMETAWEVQYDTGVNPIAIENNPDGSGRRIFVNLGPTNGFSVVDFATAQGGGQN